MVGRRAWYVAFHRRALLLFGLVALLGCAVSAPAQAGTASSIPDSPTNVATLVYEAAAGEANDVTVTVTVPVLDVVFHDAGAPVAAGSGCVSLDAHTASCAWPGGYFEFAVIAGDLDDTVSALAFDVCPGCGEGAFSRFWIRGGPGDDTLIGGREAMRLFGGPGDDVLEGGPYDDLLHGGAGADSMDGGRHDFLGDVVSYTGRLAPVRVDLVEQEAGAAGEGDAIAKIEGAVGGAGDDRLFGDGRRNRLDGRWGRDVLLGRAGADELSGGPGPDLIRAGAGSDRQVAGGRGEDWIAGGPGDDGISGGGPGAGDVSHEGEGRAHRSADTIVGGPGDDWVFGGAGADRIFGQGGADSLGGGFGPDVLVGGRGPDDLFAFHGARGNDRAVDRLFGGVGRDEAWAHARDLLRGIELVHLLF